MNSANQTTHMTQKSRKHIIKFLTPSLEKIVIRHGFS